MIRAERLAFAYRRFPWSRPRTALHDISWTAARGSLQLLAGANGAGKSTLLRLLAGLIAPTAGTLEILGLPAGSRELLNRIAWLPEVVDAAWRLTAHQMVELSAALYGFAGADRRARVEQSLADVGLAALAARSYRTLSKGERRRVGVAQALVTDAELLLLDEPLDGVDPESAERLLGHLARLASLGKTVVVSSHVLLDGSHGGDVLTLLDGGRIAASGPPGELLRGDTPGARLSFAELLRHTRSRP